MRPEENIDDMLATVGYELLFLKDPSVFKGLGKETSPPDEH